MVEAPVSIPTSPHVDLVVLAGIQAIAAFLEAWPKVLEYKNVDATTMDVVVAMLCCLVYVMLFV